MMASCVSVGGAMAVVRVVVVNFFFRKRAITGISENRPESGGTQGFTLRLVYIGTMCIIYICMLYWQLGCAQRAKFGASASTVGGQTSAIHSPEYACSGVCR
jgi:hypothetical protein